MTKLLPCPFCGEMPEVYPKRPGIEGDGFGQVRCESETCPANPVVNNAQWGDDFHGPETFKREAIAAWNRRPQPGACVQVEGLKLDPEKAKERLTETARVLSEGAGYLTADQADQIACDITAALDRLVQVEADGEKWRDLKANCRNTWSVEARKAADELEAKHDISLCSSEHLVTWVERHEYLLKRLQELSNDATVAGAFREEAEAERDAALHQRDAARKAVEAAFREGYADGHQEALNNWADDKYASEKPCKLEIEQCWEASDARQALSDLKDTAP